MAQLGVAIYFLANIGNPRQISAAMFWDGSPLF
jgi:hypothetical protein